MESINLSTSPTVIFFFAAMALIALDDVLFGGTIDHNRLVGSICVYLLLGIAWGIGYALLDTVTAEPAFTNLESIPEGGTAAPYIYYSFVTLTTLGYGDLSPLTPTARTPSSRWTKRMGCRGIPSPMAASGQTGTNSK